MFLFPILYILKYNIYYYSNIFNLNREGRITRKRRESSSSIYWVSLTSIPNPTSPFTRTLFSRALSRTDCRETRLHSIARATCHSSAQSPVTCQTFRFHFHVSIKSHRCTSSWWTFSRSSRSIENQWVEILHLRNVWIVIR